MATSIAHQTVSELGGPGSVLVRQRRDHIELDDLIERLEHTDGTDQDDVLTQLCRLVFPHAFAEEAVLWPLIRKRVPEGEKLTLQIEREHQQINELFTELEKKPHSDPGRTGLLQSIITLLREDVRDEEDELLPMLRSRMSDVELVRTGRVWETVRRISPTRPHPVVARRPPGNAVAALPLTVLDRSRDHLDRLTRHGPRPVSRPAMAVSRALATVAGWVEHLPPLTRGEDPSTRTREK
jgi:hemerythrin superfamily protein